MISWGVFVTAAALWFFLHRDKENKKAALYAASLASRGMR